MGYVLVLPELGLVVDPMVGMVTTAGESLQPVIDKVAEMEAVSNDLINMLSGKGNFLASFPGRENALPVAGGVTAFWYGMAIGLLIAGIIALKMM